jgi:hypothetical protein
MKTFFLLVWASLLASCVAHGWPLSWQASDEVEQEMGRSRSAFIYYFSGSEALPHTIIGLRAGQSFRPGLWQPAPAGADQPGRWLEAIDNRHRLGRDRYAGGWLVDEGGEVLGLWYSRYRYAGSSRDDDGAVRIRPPLRRDQIPGQRNFVK